MFNNKIAKEKEEIAYVKCTNCETIMSYSNRNTLIVQCPKCRKFVSIKDVSVIECYSCKSKMIFPKSSKFILCKCGITNQVGNL